MVWGLLWFLGILVADLWLDYNKWLVGKKVEHVLEWWQRFICIAPAFSMASSTLLGFVGVAIFGGMLYWLLFDGLYNKIRGMEWWSTGSNDGKADAVLDRVQRWLGKSGSIAVKIGGLVLSFWLMTELIP